jgi:hypothetical protein
MRFNRDIFAISLLLLLFVGGGLILGGHNQNQSRQVGAANPDDPSIFNDRGTGSKGLYDWVQALGYKAAPWQMPWQALSQTKSSFLVVVDPQTADSAATLSGGQEEADSDPTALTAADVAPLKTWLQQGHTALLLTSDLSDGNNGPDAFAQALGITVSPLNKSSGRTEFAPQQPTVDTQGVLSLHSDAPARISQTLPSGVALFGDGAGPVVLTQTYGKGRLFIVADGNFASNDNLGRSENARFLANLLTHYAAPGAVILFDEYHHGDAVLSGNGGIWGALGWPLQLFLIQLIFAMLLGIGYLAVRFGVPVPLMRGMTRTSAEYVTSLAGLFQRAGASATALETLYRNFLRDLCAKLALAPDVELEQLAETASRRGQTDRQRLRSLLAACEEHLDTGKINEADLLDLVRRMERVRKDMGIA